jgi:hypothetical protein
MDCVARGRVPTVAHRPAASLPPASRLHRVSPHTPLRAAPSRERAAAAAARRGRSRACTPVAALPPVRPATAPSPRISCRGALPIPSTAPRHASTSNTSRAHAHALTRTHARGRWVQIDLRAATLLAPTPGLAAGLFVNTSVFILGAGSPLAHASLLEPLSTAERLWKTLTPKPSRWRTGLKVLLGGLTPEGIVHSWFLGSVRCPLPFHGHSSPVPHPRPLCPSWILTAAAAALTLQGWENPEGSTRACSRLSAQPAR